jgi:solute carrier family 35 protein F1/2
LRLRGWPTANAWWEYLLLAAFDVEANFLAVLAYRYTDITSCMLIDGFTIPAVVFLSVVALGARYRWRHLVGIGIGVAGLFSAVYADLRDGPRSQQPQAVLGDMICLVGACLYAVSNTVQERLAKRIGQADLRELVGMLGCFGAILNGVQAFIFEREAFAAIPWSPEVIFAFVGYVACLFTMYTLTPHLLQPPTRRSSISRC